MVDLESKEQEIISSWNRNDRVEALKLIIQCLKSLSDTTAIGFYPTKVFLVLDVLHAFMDLVVKRLDAMDEEEAREIAKNWFYKIFSIRYSHNSHQNVILCCISENWYQGSFWQSPL